MEYLRDFWVGFKFIAPVVIGVALFWAALDWLDARWEYTGAMVSIGIVAFVCFCLLSVVGAIIREHG